MHRIAYALLIPLTACSGSSANLDRWVWYTTLGDVDTFWWETGHLLPMCGTVPHPRQPAEFISYLGRRNEDGEVAVSVLSGYGDDGVCEWVHLMGERQAVQGLSNWFPEPGAVGASAHYSGSQFFVFRPHEFKLQFANGAESSCSLVAGTPREDGGRVVERVSGSMEPERWCLHSYDDETIVLLREPETADCSSDVVTTLMEHLQEGRPITDAEWPRPVHLVRSYAHIVREQADVRELVIYEISWSGPPRQVLHMRQTEGRIVATTDEATVEVNYRSSLNRYRVETIHTPHEEDDPDVEYERTVLRVNRRGGHVVYFDERRNETAEGEYGFIRRIFSEFQMARHDE